jgi:hypothetical protein
MPHYRVTLRSYAGEANVIIDAPSPAAASKKALAFLEHATAEVLDVTPLANTKLLRITSLKTMDM